MGQTNKEYSNYGNPNEKVSKQQEQQSHGSKQLGSDIKENRSTNNTQSGHQVNRQQEQSGTSNQMDGKRVAEKESKTHTDQVSKNQDA